LSNATFDANEAVFMADAAALWIRQSSTAYVVFATFRSATQTLHVDVSSQLVLYQANDDGSLAFRRTVLDAVLDASCDATIDVRHYTYPCAAGTVSADGLEHGNTDAYRDVHGATIDQNDEAFTGACTAGADAGSDDACLAPCTPCADGTYRAYSLDRFSVIAGCHACPAGRHLQGDGDPANHDDEADCTPCEPGRFGDVTGADVCTDCPPGRYAASNASLFCETAEPGRYVKGTGASASLACPAGTISVGGADATTCTPCGVGEVAEDAGSSTCTPCESPLTNSSDGTSCTACEAGYYWDSRAFARHNSSRDGPCTQCCVDCRDACDGTALTDTDCLDCTRAGVRLEALPVTRTWWRAEKASTKIYKCDLGGGACRGGAAIDAQCGSGHTGALCGACEPAYVLDILRNECRQCSASAYVGLGTLLTFVLLCALATGLALLGQWCGMDVRHVATTSVSWVLSGRFDVRVGARLVVDSVGSSGRRRQTSSPGPDDVDDDDDAPVPSSPSSPCGASGASVEATPLGAAAAAAAEVAAAASSSGRPTGGKTTPLAACSESSDDGDDGDLIHRRKRMLKSIMTKIKIVVATYQISSAIPWVLPGVHFPLAFERVLEAISAVGLNTLGLGSTRCVVRLTYFPSLVVATTYPFLLMLLGAAVIGLYARVFPENDDHKDRARATARDCRAASSASSKGGGMSAFMSRLIYGLLLVLFFALPGCASYTLRYFQCLSFDAGTGEKEWRVLAADLTVSCRSRIYRRWRPYAIVMIMVWPVGIPLCFGLVLWRHRAQLDPPLDDHDDDDGGGGERRDAAVARDGTEEMREMFFFRRQQYEVALQQIRKLDIRNRDSSLDHLTFLFEEYEPRCWLFPVFECLRRIFLTGVVAVLVEDDMPQILIAIVGAVFSERVFAYYAPFIEDTDDAVSAVTQTQLVCIFFASFMVYVSEQLEERRRFFASDAFTAVLIVVLSTALLTAVVAVSYEIFGRRKVDEKLEESLLAVKRTSSRVVALTSTASQIFLTKRSSSSAFSVGSASDDDEARSVRRSFFSFRATRPTARPSSGGASPSPQDPVPPGEEHKEAATTSHSQGRTSMLARSMTLPNLPSANLAARRDRQLWSHLSTTFFDEIEMTESDADDGDQREGRPHPTAAARPQDFDLERFRWMSSQDLDLISEADADDGDQREGRPRPTDAARPQDFDLARARWMSSEDLDFISQDLDLI